MRPSRAQIERLAETLVKRLLEARAMELRVPAEEAAAAFAAVLTHNFEEEAAIEREAAEEAERLVRRGAPGIRRDELDLRRVQQLVMQRIAKARGFPL
jgi:hypothetical protein